MIQERNVKERISKQTSMWRYIKARINSGREIWEIKLQQVKNWELEHNK